MGGQSTTNPKYEGLTSKAWDLREEVLRFLMDRKWEHCYSKQIEEHFDLGGPELRALVNYWRCECEPICSDHTGYWYSVSETEIAQQILSLNLRAKAIMAASYGLHLAMCRVRTGQIGNQTKLL